MVTSKTLIATFVFATCLVFGFSNPITGYNQENTVVYCPNPNEVLKPCTEENSVLPDELRSVAPLANSYICVKVTYAIVHGYHTFDTASIQCAKKLLNGGDLCTNIRNHYRYTLECRTSEPTIRFE